MNAEYGAKPTTCPKPVLRRRVWSSYALEPVVNFDFQWAGRHPAHQCLTAWVEKEFPHLKRTIHSKPCLRNAQSLKILCTYISV